MRNVAGVVVVAAAVLFVHTSFADLQLATPTVTISNAILVGTQDALHGQDRFLAVPFAQPPTGTNRLRPPQPITTNIGTLTVTESPSACPQFPLTALSNITLAQNQATSTPAVLNFFQPQPTKAINPEDCLQLNVQRPTGLDRGAKLPVVVWFWGGSWEIGGISQYDPAAWLSKAISLKEPFIWVGFNYRLGAFGFLPGRQMAAEGATNLGIRDQRAVLEWVADNIAEFGGDPDKVTIYGNSGGAWSVLIQTILNEGDHHYNGKPLFRGAIMNSGTTVPALDSTDPFGQATFDDMVEAAGCGDAADAVDCLRNVDYDTFQAAQTSLRQPHDIINLSFAVRPDNSTNFFPLSPEAAIAEGHYVRVPIITGNQQDEGTFWGLGLPDVNANNDTELVHVLNTMFPSAQASSIRSLIDTYSKDITAGAPYNSGIFNEIFTGYKRLSSILGDILMIFPRRNYLDTVASQMPVWSYMATYFSTLPVLGNGHATDQLVMWNQLNTPIVVEQLYTRYTSFVAYLDPNRLNPTGFAEWPKYDTRGRKMLSFDALGTSFLKDDFRSTSYQVFKKIYAQLKM